MKYLITILIFTLPVKLFSQITSAAVASQQTATDNTVVTINSATYTSGITYLFFILTTVAAGNPSTTPTVSSGGLTLTKRGEVSGSFNDGVLVYTTVGTGETTVVTFTFPETQTNTITFVYSATSVGSIVVFDTEGASNNTANPAITLAGHSSASIISVFMNNQNPFGGTPESGWTEDVDQGNAVPLGRYSVHRDGTSDNTVNVTASASNWTGLAISLTISRRIFSTH